MIDQVWNFLKPLYVFGGSAILLLLGAALVNRLRTGPYTRAWAPLLQMVGGKIKNQPPTSTLDGEYRGRPVRARMERRGRDGGDTFSIEIPAGPGGRDWGIAHQSEKMLGPEVWRAFTKDPALQARLDAAQVAAYLQTWPEHALVQYDAARGVLSIREAIFSPSPEHFRAQLDVLESLAEANRQLNGG